jgi:phosphoglycolate phosphatase
MGCPVSPETAARRSPQGSRYVGATAIEIVNAALPRGPRRSALFDFDGTLSLIREGWQGVMIPMMVEILLECAQPGEDEACITELVTDYVTRLTGKQTVFQMMELADQVERRGGEVRDPLDYKRQYLDLLWERIKDRVADLKAGRATAEQMLVPGSLALLEGLQARGVTMYCASGTDLPYVQDESAALGLMRFFGDGDRVFGALDDLNKFSKAMVIQNIIRDHGLHGSELVGLGDGYVEIENTKEVGGVALGVASDEVTLRGIDEWKRNRLIAAGADIITPDYREQETLIAYLWGEL